MPGNDFEKQVQQKMDELNFVPSEAVWPEVEKQIAERKKRRVIFIWLPMLLLLLGGSALFYFSGRKNTQTTKEEINSKSIASQKNNQKEKDNSNSSVKQPQTAQVISKDSIANLHTAVSAEVNKQQESETANNNTAGKTKEKVEHRIKLNHAAGKVYVATGIDKNNIVASKSYSEKKENKNKVIKVRSEEPGADELAIAAKEPVLKNKVDDHAKEALDNNKDIATSPAQNVIAVDSSLATTNTNIIDSTNAVVKADSSKAATKNKNTATAKMKMQWGVNARLGASSVSDGFSGLFDKSLVNSNQNASTTPGNNNNSGIFNGGSFAAPSSLRSGFSFGLGVFISKPLGKNFSLQTGLNYNYYSTQMDVGAKIDSNNTPMLQYRTGASSSYTNKFHFIELPVLIEKQFGKTSRFAINGGFSFSLLAGISVLMYDAQKSIYISDKDLINKFQVNFIAGAGYRLFPKLFPIEVGPQISYGLSNIFDKDLYGSKHLFFGGIRAKLYLHKNK